MSSHKGVILQKDPDHLIPQGAYEAAATGCNVMGYAAVIEGELMPITDTKVMTWDEFNKFQEEFKAEPIIVFLGTYPKGYKEENVQPMVLVEDDVEVVKDGKTETEIQALVVGFAEGDFGKFAKKDGHSDEHHLFEELVKPIFDEYTQKNGDNSTIEGLMEFLEFDAQQKRLMGASSGRGVIKLMTSDNEIISFNNNKMGFVADWGSMSQHCGFGQEKASEETSTADKKKTGWWDKKKGQQTAAVETPPANNKEGPTDQKSVKGISPPKDGHLFVRSKQNRSHADKRTVYQDLCGFTPTAEKHGVGYRQCPWVQAPISVIEKTTLSWDWFEFRDDRWSSAFLDEQRTKKGQTKTETKYVQTAETKKEESADSLLTVPTDEVEWMKKEFLTDEAIKKTMQGVQGIPTLDSIEAIEKKYPSFYQKTGHNIEEAFRWPPEKMLTFILKAPKASRLLMFGIMSAYIKLLSQGDKKLSEIAGTTSATKAEDPPAASVKSSSFWDKKKTATK